MTTNPTSIGPVLHSHGIVLDTDKVSFYLWCFSLDHPCWFVSSRERWHSYLDTNSLYLSLGLRQAL